MSLFSATPMEARSAAALPEGDRWWFEPKWDGFRCLAAREGDEVTLTAKSGKPLNRYFPEVVALLAAAPEDRFVLDGELLIRSEEGSSFEALQARLHPAESRIRKLSVETPALLMLFDMLLAPDGTDLRTHPLSQRRAALTAFLSRGPKAGLEQSPGTADRQLAERWLADGQMEGVVAKRLDGPYAEGERAMVKVKRVRTADCVVGGFRYASGKRVVGSLLLGLYDDDDRLHHVGFTSGFAGRDRAELTARLEALTGEGFTGRAPGGLSRWTTDRSADWVPLRPELVVEVSFDHVTDQRFRHGTKLLRLRPDKAPRQCRMEQIL